ncbi:TIGR00730 family Rossman fold protein [Gynuella sp.]|uniref:LOG family protein n=1 Tax=Gynuella sp. TaxID=2969146 RepID=UPI003D0B2C25
MKLAVYCGSKPGKDPRYAQAAKALGQSMVEHHWDLVFGGGHSGLMGIVADAVLAHGGRAYGVIPEALVDREMAHMGLTELHTVKDMHERKMQMMNMADAFVALPGGPGTMEELFEVWTWHMLNYHQKPCFLLNLFGYYDAFISLLDNMISHEFAWPEVTRSLVVLNSVEELMQRLRRH